ncbi:hypothetical protein BS47DRAFT_1400136 [Hydnum rufescens UP504]|uniref:Uncharacterized protein n=1 Tax=Hydnum rufescens UP504 TaxID=1448309 RepID=A0A9P6AIX7_9AGAM|nr:hypothetical protein BS47DRAFT_1400136 [Hydnum rufescens UP504]
MHERPSLHWILSKPEESTQLSLDKPTPASSDKASSLAGASRLKQPLAKIAPSQPSKSSSEDVAFIAPHSPHARSVPVLILWVLIIAYVRQLIVHQFTWGWPRLDSDELLQSKPTQQDWWWTVGDFRCFQLQRGIRAICCCDGVVIAPALHCVQMRARLQIWSTDSTDGTGRTGLVDSQPSFCCQGPSRAARRGHLEDLLHEHSNQIELQLMNRDLFSGLSQNPMRVYREIMPDITPVKFNGSGGPPAGSTMWIRPASFKIRVIQWDPLLERETNISACNDYAPKYGKNEGNHTGPAITDRHTSMGGETDKGAVRVDAVRYQYATLPFGATRTIPIHIVALLLASPIRQEASAYLFTESARLNDDKYVRSPRSQGPVITSWFPLSTQAVFRQHPCHRPAPVPPRLIRHAIWRFNRFDFETQPLMMLPIRPIIIKHDAVLYHTARMNHRISPLRLFLAQLSESRRV